MKLCRSELAANDILRIYYAPRPFPLRRVPILLHCDALVTNFTAAKNRALYCNCMYIIIIGDILKLENFTTERVNQDLQDTLGANAPPSSVVARWYTEFKRRKTSTKDDLRTSLPTTVVTEESKRSRRSVLSDRHVTLRFVAEEMETSTGSVHSILHERLGMNKISVRQVLRMLTDA
ncbi:Putative uncharacterized protein FLJ37770 [Eumeta japonica]|uniref:Mos1 transposase HTH domain-containing protein n=1 Tax=Eumeta variegata TaxID=151549 RepID=A0A4C2ADW0_EUMVA|nr:Putative uncharacterized protein FLJ37770 [Eumeta japonica]